GYIGKSTDSACTAKIERSRIQRIVPLAVVVSQCSFALEPWGCCAITKSNDSRWMGRRGLDRGLELGERDVPRNLSRTRQSTVSGFCSLHRGWTQQRCHHCGDQRRSGQRKICEARLHHNLQDYI